MAFPSRRGAAVAAWCFAGCGAVIGHGGTPAPAENRPRRRFVEWTPNPHPSPSTCPLRCTRPQPRSEQSEDRPGLAAGRRRAAGQPERSKRGRHVVAVYEPLSPLHLGRSHPHHWTERLALQTACHRSSRPEDRSTAWRLRAIYTGLPPALAPILLSISLPFTSAFLPSSLHLRLSSLTEERPLHFYQHLWISVRVIAHLIPS
ncbi:hypothetical protein BDV95DRAFT_656282, partial [Massariosphaeria phaeospora]